MNTTEFKQSNIPNSARTNMKQAKESNSLSSSSARDTKKMQSAKFKIFMETQSAKPKYTRYFWEKANEQPKKDVNTPNVDRYYEKLKATRQKPQHQFKAYELQSNQIPINLYSAQMKCSVKTPPKKMIRIFNESNFYDSKQTKLTNHLQESFVAESFKNYLEKNHERIPEILNQPFLGKAPLSQQPSNYDPDFVDFDDIDFDFNQSDP